MIWVTFTSEFVESNRPNIFFRSMIRSINFLLFMIQNMNDNFSFITNMQTHLWISNDSKFGFLCIAVCERIFHKIDHKHLTIVMTMTIRFAVQVEIYSLCNAVRIWSLQEKILEKCIYFEQWSNNNNCFQYILWHQLNIIRKTFANYYSNNSVNLFMRNKSVCTLIQSNRLRLSY